MLFQSQQSALSLDTSSRKSASFLLLCKQPPVKHTAPRLLHLITPPLGPLQQSSPFIQHGAELKLDLQVLNGPFAGLIMPATKGQCCVLFRQETLT